MQTDLNLFLLSLGTQHDLNFISGMAAQLYFIELCKTDSAKNIGSLIGAWQVASNNTLNTSIVSLVPFSPSKALLDLFSCTEVIF